MNFTKENLVDLPNRYRANLINSITGPKSANLVGSINSEGQTNLALFSSCVHLGADPALIGLVVRPNVVPRHTLENILETGEYTLNHVHQSFYEKAHLTSARTEKSEFEISGLTPHFLEGFKAPFVKESEIKLGMKFIRKIDIEENGTHFVIGEITYIELPKNCLLESGDVDLAAAGDVVLSGLYLYNEMSKLKKLPYAASR